MAENFVRKLNLTASSCISDYSTDCRT